MGLYDRIAEVTLDAQNVQLAADADENLTVTWAEGGHTKSYCVNKDRTQIAACTAAPPAIQVSITPSAATLTALESQQFDASVTGFSNDAYNWSLSLAPGAPAAAQPGEITEYGHYQAPKPAAIPSTYQVLVTATSVADPTKSASATVTLLPPPAVTAPVLSPPPGAYAEGQQVTLACSTPGARINYTTDGSAPSSTTGLWYQRPIMVSATTAIRAIAYTGNLADSPVVTGVYTIGGQVGPPLFSPPEGRYTTPQTVAITALPANASIRYTTDGQPPSPPFSAVYSAPVQVNSTGTIRAVAYASGMNDSPEIFAHYIIAPPEQLRALGFEPAPGTYNSPQSVYFVRSNNDAKTRYTTDGSDPSPAHGTMYEGWPVPVNSTTTLKVMAYGVPGLLDSPVSAGVYTIVAAVAAPTNLTATVGTSANQTPQVTLRWSYAQNPANPANVFRIDRQMDAAEFLALAVLPNMALTSYVDTAVRYGTPYTYRISAANLGAASSVITASITTPAAPDTPLPPPSNLAAPLITSSTVTLTWTGMAVAVSYAVQRSSDGGQTWPTVGQPSVPSLRITGLASKTAYMFRVIARNGNPAADSPPSAPITVTTK